MKQRICTVCGHLDNKGAEHCSECSAKTIEYEGAQRDRGQSRRKKRPDRRPPMTSNKSPEKARGGSKGVIFGAIGIAAVLALVGLVFVNRNLWDPEGDAGSD